jgi:hypothetical protein
VGERVQNPGAAEEDARLLGVREQIEPRKRHNTPSKIERFMPAQNFPSGLLDVSIR